MRDFIKLALSRVDSVLSKRMFYSSSKNTKNFNAPLARGLKTNRVGDL